jgi:Major tropism determinant N-terminal domain/PQQ-like domain
MEAEHNMARRIQLRRDTAANWSSTNPTLAQGEIGIDLTNNKIKIGTGTTAWNSLAYWDDKEPSTFDGSYNSLTGKPTIPTIGAFEFAGNVITTNDSSNIVIDQAVEVKSDLLVAGNLEPTISLNSSLGSPTKQWKDIFVSEGSVYIGDIKLSNDDGTLLVQKVTDPGQVTEQPVPGSTGTVTTDRLISGTAEVILITDGPEPYTLFPAITGGDQLQIQGAEVSSVSGNLALTSQDDLIILANGSGNEVGEIKAWSFGADAILTLPAGGDIVDSNGSSVLGGGGGGEPTISNTLKGFINLVGDRPNDSDDAWFESVVVRGNYAYVLGSDYYIDNSNDRPKVYKFDVRTGEQVWVKQITAGRGATFAITIGSGTIAINGITQSGQDYKVGEEIPIDGYQIGGSAPQNNFYIVVDTVDGSGGVLTASVKPGYDVGILTYNSTVNSFYDDAQGDTVAISYDDFNDKLIVVQEYGSGRGDVNDGFWTWANVYVMDPATGVINQTVTLSDEGDIFPNSIATLEVDGGIAIVGEKYNEYRDFGPLTILAGGIGYFDILKSNLDPEHYPGAPFNNYSDFWITGTGISNQENVDNVNYYTQLPSTVQQGSGAQFQVVSAGDGIPYVSALATVPNKGSNYLVGHKIKILGTALGGATPANDAIITVTEIGEGGSIEAVTISGTGGDVGGGTYNSLTGTNHNTGSGATFYTQYNGSTGITSFLLDATGVNYVVGDILTIAGTNFANGTSPANDVEIEVTNVDGAGGVIAMQVTVDDIPTDTLRIRVDNVDFTVEGTWSMKQNLGGEAFIWTPAWTNAIGGPSGDRFYDVCWAADGQSLYAVGRGRYEVDYDQALVVKFDSTDGSIVWSKDIKFSEAESANRQARAVCLVPNSTDIMVGGEWSGGESSEIILTRITAAGTAVWQKTYAMEAQGNPQWVDPEMSLKAAGDNIVVSFEQGTNGDSSGLAYMVINPNNGTVIRHRVFSSDSAGNRVYYNTPTANISDIYSDATGDYVVMAGYTYVPTDNYYNSLLMKLPLDGLVNIDADERWSIGEHIMNRHTVNVTTVTPAFESFTADQHIDTITNTVDARNYVTRAPDGELKVWTQTITNDAAGYLEFGDGSKQSFATNVIPQINAQRDYWLTTQDSGKHIFFEHEYGTVYIPHSSVRYFPVGFTFTIVNTTGSDCYLRSQNGMWTRAIFKLAGRNITTVDIGIPDSGSGSMITVMKIKDGYDMINSDNDNSYPDIWMVSGPSDIYDNND